MKTENTVHEVCTHCACHNPMWKVLEEDIFHSSIFSKITTGLKNVTDPEGETLVISGGIIRPLIDGSMDPVEAIGIHGGKVIATGSRESVISTMNRAGYSFKEKQLKEKQALLPGLIEPHVHIVPTALLSGWLDLSRFNGQDLLDTYDVPWLKQTIRDHVQEHKLKYLAGSWILGRGVDPALMPFEVNDNGGLNKLVTFDCDLLDTIVADKALLMLSASMHTCYVNTKALRDIYDSSASVQQQYGSFDNYRAQTKGQLQEAKGMQPAFLAIPKIQIAEMALGSFKHLTQLFETANSRGVTFMYDAGMNKQLKTFLDLYIPLHEKRVRIGAAQICSTQEDADTLENYVPVKEYTDVYYGNIKLVSDGSNQGLTGYQSEAYCCEPANNYGLFNFADSADPRPLTPPDGYTRMVKTILADKGWPMMIHANGDLAVQFAIDVYDTAITAANNTSLRNRIEHCSLLTAEQISDMQRLGISPSFLIGHVGYWGYAFREAIFEDRAMQLDLCKSALNAGLKITLHSDNEVSPLGPLRMMEQSITRVMEAAPAGMADNVLNPEEKITPEQALRAVTTDAAWQCNADHWVGSLGAGYYADFVVLEQDPLTLPEYYMILRHIPVLETWRGGVQIYALQAVPQQADALTAAAQ